MQSKPSPPDSGEIEVTEVISAEPIAEAPAEDVIEAMPGVAVARDVTPTTTAAEEAVECALPTEAPPHKNGRLKHVIECMLFVSTEPLSAKQLADALQVDQETVDVALSSLQDHLDSSSGLQLMQIAGGYQLCTRPEYADYCAIILQPARKKLSKAALETLAIVAYRQPCTMPEIEAVRGVSVDGVIRTLSDRGLIKEAGRKQAPGRPALFETTPEFLEYFGLDNVSELPDIDGFAADAVKALEAQREMLRGPAPQNDEAADAD
jgi:segregation and condensation protein B